MALLGVAKGLAGLAVRPTMGLLEMTSKGTYGMGLVCLGREAISGSTLRRVRAPGALAEDSTEARSLIISDLSSLAHMMQLAFSATCNKVLPVIAWQDIRDVLWKSRIMISFQGFWLQARVAVQMGGYWNKLSHATKIDQNFFFAWYWTLSRRPICGLQTGLLYLPPLFVKSHIGFFKPQKEL